MRFSLKSKGHGSGYSSSLKTVYLYYDFLLQLGFLKKILQQFAAFSVFCTVAGVYCYCLLTFIMTWGL